MHVLVTGGTGFIGRALCTALVAEGHAVTVLTRQRGRVPGLPMAVRCIGALEQSDPAQAVVNLAGEPLADGRWTAARKAAFRSSRLGTTERLADWIRRQSRRPAVLVSASAIGYYGPGDDAPVEESSPPGSDFAAALCTDWEARAQAIEALGVRVCRVRIGIVLGRDGGALARMLPPFRAGLGGRLGDGRQWMSWVTLEDVISLLRWLIATPTAQGVYNATAPHAVRNAEFTRALAAALHRPALLPLPAPVLRALFGEMADLLLTGPRVLPSRALAEGFCFRHPELAGALTAVLRG